MTSFNRRTLISTAAASAVLLTPALRTGAFALPADDDREFESTFTGSVIELVDDQWAFEEIYPLIEEDDFHWESVSIVNDSSIVGVAFIDTSKSPEEYLDEILSMYRYDTIDIVGSGTSSDGAWFAASAAYEGISLVVSIYCEYQVGAYEEFDLVVTLNSRADNLLVDVDAAQGGILIGDLEPFMMLESSDVASLTFPGVVASSTSGRSNRTSQTSNATETTGTETTTADSSFVEGVREHRTVFMSEFGDFAGAMGIIADEASTDPEKDAAFETMHRVAALWVPYADQAAELTAPAEYADLGELYSTWAAEITELGTAWQEIMAGQREVESLFDQIDAVDLVDKELKAALEAL